MADFSFPDTAAADLTGLAGLAAALAARDPATPLGWRAGTPVTHGQFMARLRAWQALLARQGGSRYALYLDDGIEFGAALLGAWQAGKTVWLVGDTLQASCAALRGSVDGFLGDFPADCAPLNPAAPESAGEAAAALAGTFATLGAAFAALVVHTSGSTGAAQAIPKQLHQLASEVATLERLFGAQAGAAAVLATVSHQHIYGLLFKILWPLCAGRPIHALSIAFPEQLAELLGQAPCLLVSSPAHLKRLPAHLGWDGARAQLRAVFSSGGPLAPEVAQSSAALLGQVPLEVYGSSETGGIAWRQRPRGPAGIGAAADAWQPMPGVDWRLAAPDQLLEVRSPHLPDAAWLRLADRAAPAGVSAAGMPRFQLLGRSDRIAKIEEKRISLDAIELALRASALVAEARVLLCEARPGERQMLAAFVVPSSAGAAQLAGAGKLAMNRLLRAALVGMVEAVALPRRWRYLDHMPVNAQGKTTQAQLLALLEPDGAAVTTAVAPAPAPAPLPAPAPAAAPRWPHWRELERAPLRVVLELTLPADLLYFDGHFTVAPILPGVVQVDWAIAYARRYFALPAQFRTMQALKFQHVVQPCRPVHLELSHDEAKGCLQFRYFSDAGAHSSGRIVFTGAALAPLEAMPC